MKTAHELLQKLAGFDTQGALVLSIYLDMRPHATGENPALRTSDVVLKDRLREIEKTLLPRGPALEEFRKDAERVQHYLEEHAEPWLEGLAIFACDRHGLFEVLEAGVHFDDQVVLELHPDLFQLAHLIDEQETAVMALVDTNTARLFVTRRGFLEEVPGPDDDPFGYGKRKAGAINQMRYQRRAENKRKAFSREAAAAIEKLVQHEGASRVLLAGDAVAIPLLHQSLSPQIEPLVHEEILRLDIRTPRHEVKEEIRPLLDQIEMEESHEVADRLVEAIQAQGLGLSGLQETRDALEHGQVEVLVLANDAPIDEEARRELVRLATNTSARVEVVQGHDELQQLGGVGALLRYRMSRV